MTIIAAADGSALGNPGPAGWGWYVDEDRWASGGWPKGTNNMGELTAVLDLLQATAHVDEPLHVLCDSQYVINSITKWMAGWKRKGWVKKDGKPVMNVEIMKALDAALAGRKVTFEWVKGHSGHHLNEEADRLATAAAAAYKAGQQPDSGPGFGGTRAVAPSGDDAHAAYAPGQVQAEDDLFSLMDAPDEQPDPFAEVVAAERSLLTAEVRRDPASVAALLHADWTGVDVAGRIRQRADEVASPASAVPAEMEVVDVQDVADGAVLLLWRRHAADGVTVHSSWWVRAGQRWQQRFTHASPDHG